MKKFTKYPITASKYSDDDWKHVTNMQIISKDPLRVEAELDGADYVNMYYDENEGKYIIEDPFDGVVAIEDKAWDAYLEFSNHYIVDNEDLDELQKIMWEPPQWMQELEDKFQKIKSNFNPADYHIACYYTVGNSTWGFDARKYVYDAGGVVVYGFMPSLTGKQKVRASLYLFPSMVEYQNAKASIKRALLGQVKLQDPFEIDVENELDIHEIESPTGL